MLDPRLAMLRKLMGGKPNRYGKVSEILLDGRIEIDFPIGKGYTKHSQSASYPSKIVRRRKTNKK